MAASAKQDFVIIGAGPVGTLLAIYLAKAGFKSHLYERRCDLRMATAEEGRSINLVLTHRGIQALARVGAKEEVLKITVPVYGRMIYQSNEKIDYQPYGKDNSECNYSVNRSELNKLLLNLAEKAGVKIYFEHKLEAINFSTNSLIFSNNKVVQASRIFGVDGAGSVVRKELTSYWKIKNKTYADYLQPLGVEYKELFMPAGKDGAPLLEKGALHIWPRGKHFLMALPNLDGSFTMTLYLPETGENSFKNYANEESVRAYFIREYPSAYQLMPNLMDHYFKNPIGKLSTVRCRPWHELDTCLLLGDAAHGVVPFFGQGMNAGFEDCEVFDDLISMHGGDWNKIFADFSTLQKPNGDAIADMAIENFIEMSDKVADQNFLLQKQVEKVLNERFPDKYKSRYRLVVYSSLPYQYCQAIGKIQKDILTELCLNKTDLAEIDFTHALSLIDKKLSSYLKEHVIEF